MENTHHLSLSSAVEDFRSARRQAGLEEILARLSGRSTDLLSYEDVRKKLKLRSSSARGLHDIPLEHIVGSVGRYTDFTRSFLPRRSSDEERWARVKVATIDSAGLPPIEVYQVGDAYFVRDGHHRVSVARQLGAKYIQAYVTNVETKVTLSPDVQPEDLILKAEYADFLERTHLNRVRPQANLSVTVAGQYPELEEHIQVHRHFMGLEQEREIPYEEAIAHWYDEIYTPIVEVIRARDLLHEFPNRTEADLYLWISKHRAALEEELEREIPSTAAATDLATQYGQRSGRGSAGVSGKILGALTPAGLEPGPPAGEWRRERTAGHSHERMFIDLLVAISGSEEGWRALDQALIIARREGAHVYGLHVLGPEKGKEREAIEEIRARFRWLLDEAGVAGKLTFETGEVSSKICERARWNDLIILSMSHPPPTRPVGRLGSGLTTILRRCSRPVLVLPDLASPLDRLLLAYDGSDKAEEALFVATYLAGRWNAPLAVVSVEENGVDPAELLVHARGYLMAHGVEAELVTRSGPAAEAILDTMMEQESNLLLMGGYSTSPVLEMMLGSVVDRVLRSSALPTLVCR